MDNLVKLSTQGLNFLFSHLTQDDYKVLWVRNPDYTQQLYLSPAYERVWKRPCQQLYEHPESWGDTLLGENADRFVQLLKSRHPDQTPEPNRLNTVLYRIVAHQETIWIKDSTFYLFNELNEQVAVVGVAEAISQTQWMLERDRCCSMASQASDYFRDQMIGILEKELKLTATPSSHAVLLNKGEQQYHHIVMEGGERVRLTPKEMECLRYVLQGKQAKQIAGVLSLSTRTIEMHLSHIRGKTHCRHLVEFMSKCKGFAV